MASELEKGMEFMATYEPIEPAETTGRRHTGEIRWNGPTLEREVEITHYHNDRANYAEYVWEPVPQVGVAVTEVVVAEGSGQATGEVKTTYHHAEPGEHQEVLDALDAANSGEEK